jgi:hypothetical protein
MMTRGGKGALLPGSGLLRVRHAMEQLTHSPPRTDRR